MRHRLSAHQGPFSGGNRTLRICSLLCRSHTCSLATGSKRRPMDSNLFPIKGDPITDLHEDLAAEQKARTTYDNILRLVKDPEVCDPIRFLRQREIVHYQRFGESLRIVQEKLDSKNFYAVNPEFDK